MLAVAGKDGKIRLLAPPAFEPVDEFAAEVEVTVLAFSRDAGKIAWGGPKGARIWDRQKKDFATPFLPHAGPVATLAFSIDGTLLATSAHDQISRIFRVPSTNADPLFPPVAHFIAEYGINHGGADRVAPRFAAGDTTLLTVERVGTIAHLMWRSCTTGDVLATTEAIPGHEFLGAFDVSLDGKRLAVTWSGGLARLLDTQTRTIVASVPAGENYWCEDVAFSADGKILVSGGHDMKVLTCFVEDQQNLNLLRVAPPIAHSKQVVRGALSRDGKHLAAALWDGTVCLWRAPEGLKLLIELSHPGWVQTLMFSADGTELVSGCSDGLMRVWNRGTGELKRGSHRWDQLKGHGERHRPTISLGLGGLGGEPLTAQ